MHSPYDEDAADHDELAHESTRPHSIDLALELEHQLDAESLPSSPVAVRSSSRPQSLDPRVLASIITQLRISLADVAKERDGLASQLAEAHSREQESTHALHQVSEKCAKVEDELAASLEKQKEDQDAITMLRSKLDDSRKALMRLQSESRRTSQANMSIDLSRAGPSVLTGPPSSRRSSFQPLTGSVNGRVNVHRRISSVSDTGSLYGEHGPLPGSPRSQLEPLHLLSNSAPATSNPPQTSNKRMSGFFGRPTPDLPPTTDASELEELRKELQAVKEQLEETRHELSEAKEAQEASETCANALRTFIADNSIGMQPPGTSVTPSEEGRSRHSTSASGSRWSFKLWNTQTSTAVTNPSSSSPALPPPTTASVSAPPVTKKLGGFFGSRASVSSTASTPPVPHSHQQEPMCNGSDSSSEDSATEPVSPASELPGTSILVQSYDQSPKALTDSPEQQKTGLQAVDLDQGRLVTVA